MNPRPKFEPRRRRFGKMVSPVKALTRRRGGENGQELAAGRGLERLAIAMYLQTLAVLRDLERWFLIVIRQKFEFEKYASEHIARRVPPRPRANTALSMKPTFAPAFDPANRRSGKLVPQDNEDMGGSIRR